MKKNFKLVLALVLAALLLMTSAMAETKLTNSSTIHTYEVYQIFTGTKGTAENELVDLKYGQNNVNYTAGGTNGVSQADITYLDGLTDNARALDQTDIANIADKYVNLTSTPFGTLNASSELAVPTGYYLLRDTSASPSDKNTTQTLYLLQVVDGAIPITAKDSTVTLEKKVDDENDSSTAEDDITWQKDADYDVGDIIPYMLKGTLPANYDQDYDFFDYQFSDTLSTGLTLQKDSIKVVYYADAAAFAADTAANGGTDITNKFTIDKDSNPFTVGISTTWKDKVGGEPGEKELDKKGLKDITGITKDSVIVVYYKAQLNENAVIGPVGNDNTATLTFSNNPNAKGEGDNTKTTTPEEKAIVFTYEVDVDKIDENDQPLSGAKFTLFKKVVDTTTFTAAKTGEAIKTELGSTVKADALANAYYYINLGEIEATADGDKYTAAFRRLDDGEYVLVETQVPTGYNAWDAKSFTIGAEHSNGALTSVTPTSTFGLAEKIAKSSMSTSIKNQSGATLPETGGIGTTIFYVAGSIMVLAAAILLVTKRRMGAND